MGEELLSTGLPGFNFSPLLPLVLAAGTTEIEPFRQFIVSKQQNLFVLQARSRSLRSSTHFALEILRPPPRVHSMRSTAFCPLESTSPLLFFFRQRLGCEDWKSDDEAGNTDCASGEAFACGARCQLAFGPSHLFQHHTRHYSV